MVRRAIVSIKERPLMSYDGRTSSPLKSGLKVIQGWIAFASSISSQLVREITAAVKASKDLFCPSDCSDQYGSEYSMTSNRTQLIAASLS